jgi:uncharacterized protein YoxC
MILTVVILSVLTLLFGYTTYNLLRKNEQLEDDLNESDKFIVSIFDNLDKAYERLQTVDRLGSFEADDESGFIFDKIKTILEDINNEYNLNGETQTETE